MRRKLTMEDIAIMMSNGLGTMDLVWISVALAALILVLLWVA